MVELWFCFWWEEGRYVHIAQTLGEFEEHPGTPSSQLSCWNHSERGTSPPRTWLSSALPFIFCTHIPCMWEWLWPSLKPSLLRFIDFLLPPPWAKISISASVSLRMAIFHLLAWYPTFWRYSRFQRPNGHYLLAFIKLVVCSFTRTLWVSSHSSVFALLINTNHNHVANISGTV